MENNSGKCVRCKNLDLYYTKGVKKFSRTKFGWCIVKCATVKTDGGCENYCPIRRKYKTNPMIKYSINEILTELSEMRMLLEDEVRESE